MKGGEWIWILVIAFGLIRLLMRAKKKKEEEVRLPPIPRPGSHPGRSAGPARRQADPLKSFIDSLTNRYEQNAMPDRSIPIPHRAGRVLSSTAAAETTGGEETPTGPEASSCHHPTSSSSGDSSGRGGNRETFQLLPEPGHSGDHLLRDYRSAPWNGGRETSAVRSTGMRLDSKNITQ